jgi:hypothetical protein
LKQGNGIRDQGCIILKEILNNSNIEKIYLEGILLENYKKKK